MILKCLCGNNYMVASTNTIHSYSILVKFNCISSCGEAFFYYQQILVHTLRWSLSRMILSGDVGYVSIQVLDCVIINFSAIPFLHGIIILP